MFDGLLDQLTCVLVQHRNRLLSRVQIHAYNFHLGLLRSESCRLDSAQLTRLVVRPTSLCHQSQMFLCDSFRLDCCGSHLQSTWMVCASGLSPLAASFVSRFVDLLSSPT